MDAMSRRKDLLLSLLLSLATLALCLLGAEIVLRFLPVSTGLRSLPVTAADPVLHYTPNQPFTSSFGWDLHNVVHGRVNNAGFVNDQDYSTGGPPLIAVVGDSFIEAQMVAYGQTLQARLAAALKGKFRVYSFAASGAPLSQYLIWAGYAVKTYGAPAVVINVIANDFDESLSAYKLDPGFWQYAPDANGVLQLYLNPHQSGTLITLARHSALARYLILNIHALPLVTSLISGRTLEVGRHYVGTDPSAGEKRVRDSLAAIDAILRDVPERVGLAADRILFTLDGFRYADAAREAQGSYFDLMRRAFMEKAAAKGYEVIDLDTRFIPRNAASGEHFEFDDDYHWNAIGHAVAFDAVMASKLLARLEE
jgi:hypothetical protein